MWRKFAIVMAKNETIRFQFTQLLGKRAFRDFSNLSAELPETPNIAFTDVPEKLNYIFHPAVSVPWRLFYNGWPLLLTFSYDHLLSSISYSICCKNVRYYKKVPYFYF